MSSKSSKQDLKSRVITSINKLSDRDTFTIGATELDSIAKTLPQTHDAFTTFLTCIHNTDFPNTKSPARKKLVNLIATLSLSHPHFLSPHLPKLLATILPRIHDTDSAVRLACAAAISVIAGNVTSSPVTLIIKPFFDLMVSDQEVNVQTAAAGCVAAAVEGTEEVEVTEMRRVVARVVKLVRSDGFKARAACLGLLGSVVGVKGVVNRGIMEVVVGCFVEFLGFKEDWCARKNAALGLGKVALVEDKEVVGGFRGVCVKALESKRFDKVKVVRETMNRALELWKEVSGDSEDISDGSLSRSSSIENRSSVCFPLITKSSNVASSRIRAKKTVPISRSPPSDKSPSTTSSKDSHVKSSGKSSSGSAFSRQNQKKTPDWKVEIAVPRSPFKGSCEDDKKKVDIGSVETQRNEGSKYNKPDVKRALFTKNYDDKPLKFGGPKYVSRVVPLPPEIDSPKSAVTANDADEEVNENHEDLSMIQNQLVQIENQQSNLLEMLQRFIGSSQSGINSLESRVHGLEMALEDISYDLAVSRGKIPGADSAENTCCKLPGTEFLSPKFWKRQECRISTSRFPSWGSQPECDMQDIVDNIRGTVSQNRLQRQSGGIMKTPGDVPQNTRESLGLRLNTKPGKISGPERAQFWNDSGFDANRVSTCINH